MQRAFIESYEQIFQVKTVILYSYPYPVNGMNAATGVALSSASSSATLTFAPAIHPCVESLKTNATIPIPDGIWAYLANVADSRSATPAVCFQATPLYLLTSFCS